ncbi:MAG: hypothetical protein ACKO2G_11425 [Verrucomicrobiales bacterium]
MKLLIPLLAIVGHFLSPLFAQAQTPAEPQAPRGRVAWFVCTAIPEGLENPIGYMSGADVGEVTLSKRSPSEAVKIPEDGVVRLVRKIPNPEDPAKPKFLTLAQGAVPEGVNQALLILVPTSQKPGEMVFNTKVQDLARFKNGDWMYLNLTTQDVRVDMGKTVIPLKSGAMAFFDASAYKEPTNLPIRYSFLRKEDQQWQMLSASTIVIYPTRREMCIFSWDEQFNRISYHGITLPL